MDDGLRRRDSYIPPEETSLARLTPDNVFVGAAKVEWRDASGAHALLVDRGMVIGSSPDADVRVVDPTVSRVHAELDVRDDGVWVRDLQSRNGTEVQGLAIECVRVPHMGRIRIGSTELLLTHTSIDPGGIDSLWPEPKFQLLVGGSRKMRELYAKLARVAASPASVLIGGETGTGKELVARSLHLASPRADKPFVVVDCAALPENLLDAELFGHARGAFTGAVGARPGAIESANGGTVFLDEVGEPPEICSPSCSACSRRERCEGSERTNTDQSTSGSSVPPTATS